VLVGGETLQENILCVTWIAFRAVNMLESNWTPVTDHEAINLKIYWASFSTV
jgi:hypothetical protein